MSASTEELASRLHSTAIALLRSVRSADQASGLSAARLSALSVIVFGGPLTLGELAAAEQVSSPTMSRLVDALVEEDLARRLPHPTDGRARLIEASERGREVLARGRARRVARLVGEILDGMDGRELATLEEAVRLLEQALGRPPGG